MATSNISRGTVSGGGIYQSGSEVTVTATPLNGYFFLGWYNEIDLSNKLSSNNIYTLIIESDISLLAKFYTSIEDEKWNINHGVIPNLLDSLYLTYGMYPQTYVKDEELLNNLYKLNPEDKNEFGYYFYNDEYYFRLDNAKPNGEDHTQSFDDGTIIDKRATYWFKVKAIKWKILQNENDVYFVTSDLLLDNQRYNEVYEGRQNRTDYKGESSFAYANNYKYSNIRSWLNTNFYNQAFFLNSDHVAISNVDNSSKSTGCGGNPYICENNDDKIFMLSYEDLITKSFGFYNDNSRMCKTSEYSRAKGVLLSLDEEKIMVSTIPVLLVMITSSFRQLLILVIYKQKIILNFLKLELDQHCE